MCRLDMLQLLHVAVLWFYLLLPSMLCDNLRCYYSYIQENGRNVELIVTECPPNELCFKANGRYGNHSVLSARGCMAEGDCSQVHILTSKGTIYKMTYNCCDWPYCNSCPGVTPKSIYFTVTLVVVAALASHL